MNRSLLLLVFFYRLMCPAGWGQTPAWQLLPGPPGGLPATGFLAGASPGELYSAGYQGEVFRSADNGHTWQRTKAPDPCAAPDLFETYGLGPDGHWYRSAGLNFEISTDSLRTWQSTPDVPARYYLNRCVSNTGAWVSQVRGNLLFRSADQGLHWDTVAFSEFNVFRNLQYDSLDQVFYVRRKDDFLRSTDDGLTWQNITPPLFADENSRQYQLAADGHLYALIDSATFVWDPPPAMSYHYEHRLLVLRSTDDGLSWTRRMAPDFPDDVLYSSLAVTPGGRIFLFAGDYSGFPYYFSDDQGLHWAPADSASWQPQYGLFVLPDGALLGYRYPEGSFLSTDDGESWTMITDDLSWGGVNDLAFLSPDTLLAVNSNGVFRSTDGGQHWAAQNLPLPLYTVRVKAGQALLSGGGIMGPALWHSADQGVSFQSVPLPDATPNTGIDFLFDASGWLFLTMEDSVYRSADWGAHWEALIPLPYYGSRLYAFPDGTLVCGGGFTYLRSADLGLHWTSMNVPGNMTALTIGADGVAYGNLIYPSQAVIWTTDQGLSWQSSTQPPAGGLLAAASGALVAYGACDTYWISYDHGWNWAAHPSPTAATYAGQDPAGRLLLSRPQQGLWRTEQTVATQAPAAEADWTISPNPAGESVRLSLKAGFTGMGRWRIFDARGRLVAQLPVTGPVTTWSRGDLPAGLYFFRVQAGGRSFSGEVVWGER